MKWYFLRHAETAANVGRLYNPDNDELTATGKEQCLAASTFIQQLSVDEVFASPLFRAQETARLLGVKPILAPPLTDRNFGDWAGKPYGGLKTFAKEHGIDPGKYAPPGGESSVDVHKRVMEFLDTLPDGEYLFISHAGVIMQVIHELTGKPWSYMHVENVALWVFEDGKLIHENWKPWEH